MKSNLQDTRNNSSDYFFTEVLSRLFYTFVLSCCTNDLPAYRRCASHPSTQLILCFMLFPDYISTALASTWYARSYFCPIESSGYMSLHINLNIDQFKISSIIFRILIRCTFKLYIYYALSPVKCIGCNDMFPAYYGDHENDAHLSDSSGIAKINLNSISSKQLIASALYTSSLLLYRLCIWMQPPHRVHVPLPRLRYTDLP